MTREPSVPDYDRRAADVPHGQWEQDRRAGERRGYMRRAEDRTERLRTMAAMVFAICGGLAVVYVFFAAFGAVDLGDAVAASIVAVVLGLVWLVGFWIRLRTGASRVTRPDRERRGY